MSGSASPLDRLKSYSEKRDFSITGEPVASRARSKKSLSYVVQKHWASRLHYDFRLEFDGVLLSWALPKGLSFDPKEKRIAIQVEDHPVSYRSFEGTIPPRQYGAGRVIVWDRGSWQPEGQVTEGLAAGKLIFQLHGEKLAGGWELVRIAKPGEKQDQWMLFKKKDEWARSIEDYDVITALPDSVIEKPLGLLEDRVKAGATQSAAVTAPAAPEASPASGRAVRRALPEQLAPQLATLASTVPAAGHWLYEIKFDGYRVTARIERNQVKLFTRNGFDWTDRMPGIARDLAALKLGSAWLDGEVVALDPSGILDFAALQQAFDRKSTEALNYFVFDVPFLKGYDLRELDFLSRKQKLKEAFAANQSALVRYTECFEGAAATVLASACQMKLEGVIAKRSDARYVSERSDTWLKLKCSERQEFVIAGFTERAGAQAEIGGLVLAVHRHGTLSYAGNVGTGWNQKESQALFKRLCKIETDKPTLPPDEVKPGRWAKRTTTATRWVKPVLVAEVAFSSWTPSGHVRHPSFKGLRADKPANQVTTEVRLPEQGANPDGSTPSVRISNPERVIDASSGIRKLDLVRFYESIAERMLPHLLARPVALLRGPSGIAGELFFQKHDDKLSIPGMRELDASLWPGHGALLEAPTTQAIVNAAQMNVIEFHTWNSTTAQIDCPDRVIFDIDPGAGVTWLQIQEAAVLVRGLLEELGLKSWLKTSGGKGLHVVVPLAAVMDTESVRHFSQVVVQTLTKAIPSRFVSKNGAERRVGKIFVDWIRNGHAQTTVSAFSARARPGLGVSMPISWQALDDIKRGDQWTIRTAREYLSFESSDPWADYWLTTQDLELAFTRLKLKRPSGKTAASVADAASEKMTAMRGRLSRRRPPS
jgi:bifunctional non-homologous end joining protein LigD